jgi:release factor glutamine methyltransferase
MNSQRLWTIRDILTWTGESFSQRGIESARLDAEVLLAHVLECDRIYLYTHWDRPLNKDERDEYRSLVKRRAVFEPVAYLIGYREFYSRNFKVNSKVLVPRPESEHLVDIVIDWSQNASHSSSPLKILDLCTGSGNIGITLALEIDNAQVTSCDLCPHALEIARENARVLGPEKRLNFKEGDLFAPVHDHTFDVIVANPPYVEDTPNPPLPPDVDKYEPALALYSGKEGLDLITRLCAEVHHYLRGEGLFVCEMGDLQVPRIIKELEHQNYWDTVRHFQDLSRLRRGVIATKCIASQKPSRF